MVLRTPFQFFSFLLIYLSTLISIPYTIAITYIYIEHEIFYFHIKIFSNPVGLLFDNNIHVPNLEFYYYQKNTAIKNWMIFFFSSFL